MFKFTWDDLATLTEELAEELQHEVRQEELTIREINSMYKVGDVVKFYSAGCSNGVSLFEDTMLAQSKISFTLEGSGLFESEYWGDKPKHDGCFISNSASEPNYLSWEVAALFAALESWWGIEEHGPFVEFLVEGYSDDDIAAIKKLLR